jgi:hypothetical protein
MSVGKTTTERLHFCDETGRRWTAFEVRVDMERCLVFDTSDTFRRVRQFPENWRELSPGELVALSWKR